MTTAQRPLDKTIHNLTRDEAHTTDWYADRAFCSLGDAALALLRLERLGKVARGKPSASGMTWKRGPVR